MERYYPYQFEQLKRHAVSVKTAQMVLAGAVRIFLEEVDKADGKVLNKRLTNKTQERLHAELGQGFVYIDLDRGPYYDKVTFYLARHRSFDDGAGHAIYIDGDLQTDLYLHEKSGVVVAENFHKAAAQMMAYDESQVRRFQDAVTNFKQDQATYAAALAEFQRICSGLNPLLIDNRVYTYMDSKAWEARRDAAK